VVAGRSDAVSATGRTAVTPSGPNAEWPDARAPDTRTGTAITAEIPAVPVAPSYGVLLPDGSVWYPGSRRKLPAPTVLRVLVWLLALLVAMSGAGLVIEHVHPSWMDPFRHVVGAPGTLSTIGGSTSTSSTGSGSGMMRETSQTATSATYSVPGAPYELAIKTTQRCDVLVKSSSGAVLFSSTLGADVTQTVNVQNGPATLQAFAGGASLSVSYNGKTVGTIDKVRYAVTYNFELANS